MVTFRTSVTLTCWHTAEAGTILFRPRQAVTEPDNWHRPPGLEVTRCNSDELSVGLYVNASFGVAQCNECWPTQ
jgi:hypothetical protein